MRKKGNHQKLCQACCVTEKDRKMSCQQYKREHEAKTSEERSSVKSSVNCSINYPEPIPMTDEDKQLIDGKEDRGKEAKREIICGLTTNYKHNSQTHSSYFRKYQVFSHVVAESELPFIHLTKIH